MELPSWFIALALSFVVACGGSKAKGADQPGGGGEGNGGGGGAVTLVSIDGQGGSCRATVKDAGGSEKSYAADPALCPGGAKDASRLVGKAVALEIGGGGAGEPTDEGGDDPCADIPPVCGDSAGGEMVIGISAR